MREEDEQEEDGWMDGWTEGRGKWKRRTGSLVLRGTAGLRILDPWCPGFQSGGGTEREERLRQDGCSNILAEKNKSTCLGRNIPGEGREKGGGGCRREEGPGLIHALCALYFQHSETHTEPCFMKSQ